MAKAKASAAKPVEEVEIIGFRRNVCRKCSATNMFDFKLSKCMSCGAPMSANPRRKGEDNDDTGGIVHEQVDAAV